MADIFISYSSKDRAAIKRISEFFELQGWTTWWDRQIPVAASYESVLMAELERSKCVLVVWSQHSVNSLWVKREAEQALKCGKLVPVMLRLVKIPTAFNHIEAAFPESWLNTADNDEIQNLLTSVTKLVPPANKLFEARKSLNASSNNKAAEASPLWNSWSVRHTYLLTGVFVTLILYVIYLFVLKGWGLAYFQILRFSIFISISAALAYCLFIKDCIDKNIIAPRLSQTKQTSVWLIPIITLLLNTALLPLANKFRISGNIESKAGQPVSDAQISIDGTPYFAYSMSNGNFSLEIVNYQLGDKIVLHVNHDNYEDSESGVDLSTFVIRNARVILSPIDTTTLTLNDKVHQPDP